MWPRTAKHIELSAPIRALLKLDPERLTPGPVDHRDRIRRPRLINHVGPGLIYRLEQRLGADTPRVATAYAIVQAVFSVDELWDRATELRDSTANADSPNRQIVQYLIEQWASWMLRNRPLPVALTAEIERFAEPVGPLLDIYPVFDSDGARRRTVCCWLNRLG
jgi:hypothetical protein